MVIKDMTFHRTAESVKPDAKNRVVLRGIEFVAGVTYHIYRNKMGQIVLDPQVSIPASELWLFSNPEALTSVRRGLIDAGQGRVSKVDMDDL